MSSLYSEVKFYVKGTDCGANSKLAPSVLFGDMQECADTGAQDLGFDRYVLKDFNACWILLRMRVHVIDMPKWRDSFSVRTWSTGCDKFFFDREFEALDSEGNVVAQGSSIWIMADIVNHRPIIPAKVEGFAEKIVVQNSRLVFDEKCPKLKAPSVEELQDGPVVTKYADYSELDWNNHVNNTRYIAWICDALYKAGINPGEIKDIVINYISEVKEGEKIDLYVDAKGEKIKVYGYRDLNNNIFAAEIFL